MASVKAPSKTSSLNSFFFNLLNNPGPPDSTDFFCLFPDLIAYTPHCLDDFFAAGSFLNFIAQMAHMHHHGLGGYDAFLLQNAFKNFIGTEDAVGMARQ